MTARFRFPAALLALAAMLAGLVAAFGAPATVAATPAPTASTPAASTCTSPGASPRNPANPLELATPPSGGNPLSGASFNVAGPAHGAAAGAIAQLLGVDTHTQPGTYLKSFSETESWATYEQRVNTVLLPQHPAVKAQVLALEKIASQEQPNRLSSYAAGGGYKGLYQQTTKLFCHNLLADPGSVPILTTYFLHGLWQCPTAAQIAAKLGTFKADVNGVRAAIGNRPAVLLLETDAIGTSRCTQHAGGLSAWLAALKWEVDTLGSLPHVVAYVEGGYSDSNSPGYTASALNKVDIGKIAGFWTNDTHNAWTINEINWGEQVSKLTHGAHFVVNTATNGRGPLVPSNRVKYGNEVLCNPPNRGLGIQPTTSTGYPNVDAFLWSSPPGNSSGPCNGGPPGGAFWTARAIELGQDANAQLGPGLPSKPY